MIIHTPEYDPMFADDGIPFRTKMIQYIEREFSDLLEPHAYVPQTDRVRQTLAKMYSESAAETTRLRRAA